MCDQQSVLRKRKSKSLLSIRELPFKKRVLEAKRDGFLDENFIPIDHLGLVLCGLNCNKSIDITYNNSTKRISYVNISNVSCIISLYSENILISAFQMQFKKNVPDFYSIFLDSFKKHGYVSLRDSIHDPSQIVYILKII